MKKIFLVIAIIITILGLGSIAYYLSLNKEKTTTITAIKDNINWEQANSYDLTLTKSTSITKGGVYNITGTIEDGE